MQKTLDRLDYWLSFFRMCAGCSRSLGLSAKNSDDMVFLCHRCNRAMEPSRLKCVVLEYPYKTFSLYRWNEENERLVRRVVMSLKGGGATQIFYNLAQLMWAQKVSVNPQVGTKNFSRHYFIPAPGRKGLADFDHAESLALQLSKIAGGQFFPVLRRVDDKQQKRLPQAERATLKRLDLNRKEHLKACEGDKLQDCSFVFVDDIITTGGTAGAAHRALGFPKNFEVWTIFCRPLLRAYKESDITQCK